MLKYDYIILGSGAAGLSLLLRMIESEYFKNKKILLIDRSDKTKNDRTWCFWEKDKGYFEDIVYKKWEQLCFHSNAFSSDLDIRPYQYKMIRGIDFYNHCFQIIKQQENIEIKYGEVRSVVSSPTSTTIYLENEQVHCTPAIIFNSLYKPSSPVKGEVQLLQHFKGWFIEAKESCFNPGQATLMDFRVHQRYGTSFIYVLPLSSTRALIEYTLFTPKTLLSEQYDAELRDYLANYSKLKDYSITEEEFGIIPMSNATFRFRENGMYNIGIAGGQTKASTGYTFQFIQKQSRAIVECLSAKRPLSGISPTPKRFHFYDTVFLQLLAGQQLGGGEIFARLFKENKASRVFKFLDNETSLAEELRLISTLQTVPYLKSALRAFRL